MNNRKLLLQSTVILEQFTRLNARPNSTSLRRLRKLQKKADKMLVKVRKVT